MEEMLRSEDLEFAYTVEEEEGATVQTVYALRGVSVSVRRGEFIVVLGHNGSGKSTLAKHCNAIYIPTSGKVLVDNMDTSDEELKYDIRQTVGMVFQNPDNQIVATTVEEDVAFGPENIGVPARELRERVDNALSAVGMLEYAKHQPHKLSGGQKQRVAIAGVIAMQTSCIVLDEPTAMLDPQGRIEVMSTIRRLNEEQGITVVYITHYMEEAAMAERVIVIDDGKILFDAPPKTVFKHVEELKAVGLDVPQATELLYMLRKEGLELPDDVINVDECVDILTKLLEG